MRSNQWYRCLFSLCLILSIAQQANAQVSYRVYPSQGASSNTLTSYLSVSGANQTRTKDSFILYTDDFGPSTRTNPYGIEVVATLQPTLGRLTTTRLKTGKRYLVTAVTKQQACQQQGQLSLCGNAKIPKDGIVLSATGTKKDVLRRFQIGESLTIVPQWFQRRTQYIDAVNPTVENNPRGHTYPGLRASNQLLIYDRAYGEPTTGTNEFGFEVTVQNNTVTAQEGADSTVPANGFILSGHGRNRDWLVQSTPIGAEVTVEPVEDKPYAEKVTSVVSPRTYRYRLNKGIKEASGLLAPEELKPYQQSLTHVDTLITQGDDAQAAERAHSSLEDLNHHLWAALPGFDDKAVRGVWHRPSELTTKAIGERLDSLKTAGINTVFLETFYHGMTIFPSQTMAAYRLTKQYPKYAGLDHLKTWIDLAHARGMKVHAWTQDFYCGNLQTGNGGGPILKKYPKWANVQKSSLKPVKVTKKLQAPLEEIELTPAKNMNSETDWEMTVDSEPTVTHSIVEKVVEEWEIPAEAQPIVPSTLEKGAFFLDPVNSEATTFVKTLLLEMASRYELDGIQLDYVRYPASFPPERYSYVATTWGYTPLARKTFMQAHSVDPVTLDPKKTPVLWQRWNTFKSDHITQFVADISKAIHVVKPKIKITAAVFPGAIEASVKKHQDWRTWVEKGYVDGLAPMTLTSAPKVIAADMKRITDVTQHKVPVYAGIFGAFNNNSAEQLLQQIATAKTSGADGFSLFETAHITGRQLKALAAAHRPKPVLLSPAPKIATPATLSNPDPKIKKHKKAKPKKKHWFWPF